MDNLRTVPKFNHKCSLDLLRDGTRDGLLYLRRSSSAHGRLLVGVRELLDDEFEPPSSAVSCIDGNSLVTITVSVDNCGNELVDLHRVDNLPERVDQIDKVNGKIEVARERVVRRGGVRESWYDGALGESRVEDDEGKGIVLVPPAKVSSAAFATVRRPSTSVIPDGLCSDNDFHAVREDC
jgi:hypothetical protein